MTVNEHYNKTDPLTRLPYHCAALLSFLSEVTVCGAERDRAMSCLSLPAGGASSLQTIDLNTTLLLDRGGDRKTERRGECGE